MLVSNASSHASGIATRAGRNPASPRVLTRKMPAMPHISKSPGVRAEVSLQSNPIQRPHGHEIDQRKSHFDSTSKRIWFRFNAVPIAACKRPSAALYSVNAASSDNSALANAC